MMRFRVVNRTPSNFYSLWYLHAQVHPEGKYVVDLDQSIDITKITPSTRVALRNDSYVLHLILPSKVDPLVNLMKVEKVPDSTYDMIGGLDQQIKEIKEVNIWKSFPFSLLLLENNFLIYFCFILVKNLKSYCFWLSFYTHPQLMHLNFCHFTFLSVMI